MNRNLRWSIGMTAILLAMFACTNQADAQSTYTLPYQSFNGSQVFNGRLATWPQSNTTATYSPRTYSPPASTFYRSQPQTQNSFLTPPLKPATSYNMPQSPVFRNTRRLYSQKTIAGPPTYYPNTAQSPTCLGGS